MRTSSQAVSKEYNRISPRVAPGSREAAMRLILWLYLKGGSITYPEWWVPG